MSGHVHAKMDFPPGTERDFAPFGAVDLGLLGDLISAEVDRCTDCVQQGLLRIGELPATVGKLVAMTGAYFFQRDDRVPEDLADPEAPGITGRDFRQVFAHVTGAPGYEQLVHAAIQVRTPQVRRIVAEDALRVLYDAMTNPESSANKVADNGAASSRTEFLRQCKERALETFEASGSEHRAMMSLFQDLSQGPDEFRLSVAQEIRSRMQEQSFEGPDQFRAFLNSLR